MNNSLNFERPDESLLEMLTVKEEPVTVGYVEGNESNSVVNNNAVINQDENSLDEPFCFETDQAALKNNQDYQDLLQAIILLEAQRMTALKDVDTLIELRERALEDPISFVDKLQRRVDIGIPRPIKIANLPVIDWSKYSEDVDAVLNSCVVGRGSGVPLTRNKLKASVFSDLKPKIELLCGPDSTAEDIKAASDRDSNCAASVTDESSDDKLKVKGRSVTFNQKWTVEEQKRFEELLRKYPPERNQTKRHEKIAKDLGTRTTAQVASHMQKYILKLAERKLPIPGPKPNNAAFRRRAGRNVRHRYREGIAGSSSTFLMSYQVPVNMSEADKDDQRRGLFSSTFSGHESVHSRVYDNDNASEDDSDDDIPQHLKTTSEYIELKMWKNYLKRQQQQQQLQMKSENSQVAHRCYICHGVVDRLEAWRCVECSVSCICMLCSKTDFNDGTHLSSHLLERVNTSSADVSMAIDRDYDYTTSDTYSYLDPNYKLD